MTLFGWDASDYDWARGPMDIAAAQRDGITWFTHKATEGTTTQHRHLRDALNRGRAAGIEFLGAYHVVRTAPSASAQVGYFLAYLDAQVPWWREYPGFFLQVDLEKWPYDTVSAATGKVFAAELKRRSPKTVITYASRGQYGDSLAGIVTPLWNAAYGTNPVAGYRQAYPGDGSPRWAPYSGQTPIMLQYGSKTRIGSQTTCDANACRGTLEQLRTLIITGQITPITDGDDMAKVFWFGEGYWLAQGGKRELIKDADDMAKALRLYPGSQFPGVDDGKVFPAPKLDSIGWTEDEVDRLLGRPYTPATTGGGLTVAQVRTIVGQEIADAIEGTRLVPPPLE